MFFSEYRHNIDAKGRLSIPSDMRNQCGDSVFVTKGHDGCLAVYTEEGWEEYYKELLTLSKKKAKVRQYIRTITARVKKCDFDKLGRINIPLVLREAGHLVKECSIIGVGDYIEIWDSQMWDDYYNEGIESFDDISEELDDE